MKVFIFLIRNFVYSNLFVSFCIALLTHQTYILLKLNQVHSFEILAFVFCSTLFTYNFQRIYRLSTSDLVGKVIGFRLSWIIRNRKKLFFLSLLAALFSGYFLSQLSNKLYLLIIPLAVLSVVHVIPIFKKNNRRIAIRELPLVKIFVIAAVWSTVIVALPVADTYGFEKLKDSSTIFLWSEQFLYIFAITLPFDIRDLRYDIETEVKTIPMVIGIRKTILLSTSFMLVFIGLKYIQYAFYKQLTFNQMVATVVSSLFVVGLISFSRKNRSELFYSGLVEGTMMLMYFSILMLEY